MKHFIFLILFFVVSGHKAHAKCKGFEDFPPHYCVKIKSISKPTKTENGCVFKYSLLEAKPSSPINRDFPAWHEKFESEGSEHLIEAKEEICEMIAKDPDISLEGVSAQRCYDTESQEETLLTWVKSLWAKPDAKPNFEFSLKANIYFHDKGNIQIQCPAESGSALNSTK